MNTNAAGEKIPATPGTELGNSEVTPQSYPVLLLERRRAALATIRAWISRVDGQDIMACGAVFVAAILFYFCIEACRHGFDLHDEAYYLIYTKSPHLYNSMASRFGAVYHPIFMLFGESVFLLRVVNMVCEYALSFLLAYLVLRESVCENGKKHIMFAAAASIAAVSFTQHLFSWGGGWLATPSYNSLNFEALLVCMIGVVLVSSNNRRSKYLGAVVAGCGCALSFFVKPTSTFLLYCCLFIYFFPNSREKFKILCIVYGASAISIVLGAWLIAGSPLKFAAGLWDGYIDGISMSQGHSIIGRAQALLALTSPRISLKDVMGFELGAMYLLLSMSCQRLKEPSILMAVFSCLAVLFLFMFPGTANSLRMPNHFYLVYIAGAALLCVVYVAHGRKDMKSLSPGTLVLAMLFFAMPAVYTYGTVLDQWGAANMVLIFPVIGAVLVFKLLPAEQFLRLLPAFAMNAVLLAAVPLAYGQDAPFGQEAPFTQRAMPIRTQNTAITIGSGEIKVSEIHAKYIDTMREKARQGGFTPGTPVLDLEGFVSPGIMYLLDAEAVGSPWILTTHYKDVAVLDYATRIFKRVPRDKLLRSWLLMRPGAKRRLSDEIFTRLDLNFPDGYEKRAEWRFAEGELPLMLYAPKVTQP